ncbi:MAG TPA: pilus assembly protein N-terminal domain-containing protein [Polyangiaceae bacterium]|nr:pilus assembly protein N-terminal domain-containing protein [Polyangiaceae bacterium]
MGAAGLRVCFAVASLALASGCGKRPAEAPETDLRLPPSVELAVNEQAVLSAGALEGFSVEDPGVVNVVATPRWLLLGGVRPGSTRLRVRRKGENAASVAIAVREGAPRRGVEIALDAGEARVLDVPEVLSYEVRGAGVFKATLESPRAIGLLGAGPGVGTLAVIGKNGSYALYRVVVRPRPAD